MMSNCSSISAILHEFSHEFLHEFLLGFSLQICMELTGMSALHVRSPDRNKWPVSSFSIFFFSYLNLMVLFHFVQFLFVFLILKNFVAVMLCSPAYVTVVQPT
jgi:hypothetical protein